MSRQFNNFVNRLEEYDIVVITDEQQFIADKKEIAHPELRMMCNNDHEFSMKVSSLSNKLSALKKGKEGGICAECEKPEISGEEQKIREVCQKLGFEFKRYDPKTRKVWFVCVCGNEAHNFGNNMTRKDKTPYCIKCLQNNYKHSYKDVEQMFQVAGYILLSTEYKNRVTPLEYMCACGTVKYITLGEFISGRRCGKCKGGAKKDNEQIEEISEEQDSDTEESDEEQVYEEDNEPVYGPWLKGKPAGCIHLTRGSYQVLFRHGSKCFSKGQYGSLENAKQAALNWQYKESVIRKLVKNMIRVVEPPNSESYLEVQLQHGHIMKCDLEHMDIVEESIWTAWKGKDKKVFYARRRESKKLQQEYAMFHNLVCPDYPQIDHINRDGLDNRSSNLRDGTVVNPKNKGIQVNNASGNTGVYLCKGSWCAQIGGDGTRKRAAYSINKYGNDAAKQMAIQTRRKWEKELGYGEFS